jgi:hypothetical protein
MGFFSKLTKPFKKIVHKITGRGNSGQGASVDPTPAPTLELANPEGEAEKKEETTKVQLRKGKKGLRINKARNADVSAGTGRNLV